MKNTIQIHNSNTLAPNQVLEPDPNITKREMSKFRIMNSRVLGESTERIRDQLEEREFEGDQYLFIQGKKNEENSELLQRSAIAVANSSSSSETILSHILVEGVNMLKIKPLGGMLHLISFESMEDKRAMIESK